jgi:hypothetical protein
MPLPRCRYCLELFTLSRYHPEQVVSSRSACQQQRRTDYHRQRTKDDPSYHAQCRDSQQKWRDRHPDFMPNYRKSGQNREKSRSQNQRMLSANFWNV